MARMYLEDCSKKMMKERCGGLNARGGQVVKAFIVIALTYCNIFELVNLSVACWRAVCGAQSSRSCTTVNDRTFGIYYSMEYIGKSSPLVRPSSRLRVRAWKNRPSH